jgi:hypothetical protein
MHEDARGIGGKQDPRRAVAEQRVGQHFLALLAGEIVEAAAVDNDEIGRALMSDGPGIRQRTGRENLQETELSEAFADNVAMTRVSVENDNAGSGQESHYNFLTGFAKKNHPMDERE